jgi:hypothetical protein
MFTIFGSPRSGTSLLAATLDKHSRIAVPPETDFIIPAAFVIDRIPDALVGKKVLRDLIVNCRNFAALRPHIGDDDVSEIIDRSPYALFPIVDAIYRRFADRSRFAIAGDKSPNDLRFARILMKLGYFPDEHKVIHLVRDVRAAAESLIRMNWRGADTPVQFARVWSQSNVALNEHLAGRPSYLLLRYEDLVADPRGAAERVCRHLDMTFEPAMLEPEGRDRHYDLNTPKHARLNEPITSGLVNLWEKTLQSRLREDIERASNEGLGRFGYRARS